MKTSHFAIIVILILASLSPMELVHAQSYSTINPNNTTLQKNTTLWSYDPPSYPGPIAISSNGSFVAVGTRQDDKQGSIFFLNNNGEVDWSHTLSGFVTSVSMSPDGEFVEARTIQTLNNGGTDFGYNEWNANPDVYVFDKTGQTIYHNPNLLPTWRLLALSDDKSFAASGNTGGIFYSDSSGKVLWKYNTTDKVASVSISPNGSFVAACTNAGIFSLDAQGKPVWNYKTNQSSDICPNIASSNLGYVLAGQALSNNTGDLYLFDKDGNLLWRHTDVPRYADLTASQNYVISSDGQYAVEVTGQSNRGYGLTVTYDKIERISTVPEFPLASIILVSGIASVIMAYKIKK